MIRPPRVTKSVGSALTKREQVKRVVLGVALATGFAVVGGSPISVQASIPEATATARATPVVDRGALLLVPASELLADDKIAYHYSHRSHYSHQSHRSHYSHYSSY